MLLPKTLSAPQVSGLEGLGEGGVRPLPLDSASPACVGLALDPDSPVCIELWCLEIVGRSLTPFSPHPNQGCQDLGRGTGKQLTPSPQTLIVTWGLSVSEVE